VISRLVYLDGASEPLSLRGEILDRATADISRYLKAACDQLSEGRAVPGPDARDRFNDLKLALPADVETYFLSKWDGFTAASGELAGLWRQP
jgi:hypothetical protein